MIELVSKDKNFTPMPKCVIYHTKQLGAGAVKKGTAK